MLQFVRVPFTPFHLSHPPSLPSCHLPPTVSIILLFNASHRALRKALLDAVDATHENGGGDGGGPSRGADMGGGGRSDGGSIPDNADDTSGHQQGTEFNVRGRAKADGCRWCEVAFPRRAETVVFWPGASLYRQWNAFWLFSREACFSHLRLVPTSSRLSQLCLDFSCRPRWNFSMERTPKVPATSPPRRILAGRPDSWSGACKGSCGAVAGASSSRCVYPLLR